MNSEVIVCNVNSEDYNVELLKGNVNKQFTVSYEKACKNKPIGRLL